MQYRISINNKRTNPCVLLTCRPRYFHCTICLKQELCKSFSMKFFFYLKKCNGKERIWRIFKTWAHLYVEWKYNSYNSLMIICLARAPSYLNVFWASFCSFSYDKNSRTCVSYHSWHSWLTCFSYMKEMKLKVPNDKDKVNPSEILRTPPWFGWLYGQVPISIHVWKNADIMLNFL